MAPRDSWLHLVAPGDPDGGSWHEVGSSDRKAEPSTEPYKVLPIPKMPEHPKDSPDDPGACPHTALATLFVLD